MAGAEVLAIEEHVDYWNQLGWTDPFSSPQYRARQNDYAIAFHASDIFTPQMVVNGQTAFVGSDMNRAYHEIGAAAQSATTLVNLGTNPNSRDPDLLDLSVQVTNPKTVKWRDSNVYLAVTEKWLDHVCAARRECRAQTCATPRWCEALASSDESTRREPTAANWYPRCACLANGSARTCARWYSCKSADTFRITGASVVDLH